MKYWWLKKYKGLKIKLIPDLTRDVNTYMIMPKHYKDRYLAIQNSDIPTLTEEDLRILLYSILNHEKIKNNKIILIIDHLLETPDNSLVATNYSLEEMLEEIKTLKNRIPTEEKLSSNNVAACYHCMQVFYVDKIKYVNKKGHCLCPYCKSPTLYFDNDFIPMDDNFLRLAKLVHDYTILGCKFTNIQKLLKKCVHIKKKIIEPITGDTAIFKCDQTEDIVLEKDHINFQIEPICYKKQITSKEEMGLHYLLNDHFHTLEKQWISNILIDTSIISGPNAYILHITLIISILENLGKNPYIKNVTLLCPDTKIYNMYKKMITNLLDYTK